MKPRHFWAIYNAKTAGKRKKSGLTRKDTKRLRLMLEREMLKDAAKS